MINRSLFLLGSFFFAFSGFAAWNINCDGQDGSGLKFSESSVTGQPLLSFSSSKYDLEFYDRGEVFVYYSTHDGGMMSIHAVHKESLDRDVVFFLGYDYLRLEAPNLKEKPEFDAVIRVERHQQHAQATLELYPAHCKAQWVVY